MACRKLGWDRIPSQYTDELDPLTLQIIEFEENAKRQDLPWQEVRAAAKKYHDLKCQMESNWSQVKTAEVLGVSPPTISEWFQVLEAAETKPEILREKNYSVARNTVQRQQSRKDAAASISLEELTRSISAQSPVQVADFNEWAKSYSGPKFNFLHLDFPYGINADQQHQGSSVVTHGAYKDTPETYCRLLDTFCRNLDRFCDRSAHMMFWFSMKHYERTWEFLNQNTDFIIDQFPLVWVKSNNMGLLPDQQRGPRRIYETALFGRRGDRKIVQAVSNAANLPSDQTLHMSTKPVPVFEYSFVCSWTSTRWFWTRPADQVRRCGRRRLVVRDMCSASKLTANLLNEQTSHWQQQGDTKMTKTSTLLDHTTASPAKAAESDRFAKPNFE